MQLSFPIQVTEHAFSMRHFYFRLCAEGFIRKGFNRNNVSVRWYSGNAMSRNAKAENGAGKSQISHFYQLLALVFAAGAGYKVLPMMSTSTVPQALKLLDAETLFLQESGMSRLQLLLQMPPARAQAIELGAVKRLLVILEQKIHCCTLREVQESNEKLEEYRSFINYTLSALLLLSEVDEGLEQLRKEDAFSIISRCTEVAKGVFGPSNDVVLQGNDLIYVLTRRQADHAQ